jgi:hypothetical protein
MVRRWWVAAVVVTSVLAGCGRETPAREPGPPVWVEAECPRAQVGPGTEERGAIPDDFVTAHVLRCRSEVREVPGEGSWTFQVTEHAETSVASVASLVELLRGSSAALTADACRAMLVIPPYVLLVDAEGRAVLPAVPTDECGQPRQEIIDAVEDLPYRVVSETRLDQSQTERSAETGCSDPWKDMTAIDAGTAGAARPLWPEPVDSLRVCVYGAISGGDLPVGRLETAHELTSAPAADLVKALDGTGPAAACTDRHSRFAVLQPDGQASWATVELDGCRRVQRPDGTLGQLDARTIGLVTAR